MNPIAKWCEIKGYIDWCYKYYIPDKSEFIDGFEYEFRGLTCSIPGKGHVTEKVNVYWDIYTVGKNKDHQYVIKHLDSYLEAGYIRVMKANERIKLKEKHQTMSQNIKKLFYYSVDYRWILTRNPETNEIEKYEHDFTKEKDIEFVVIEANSVQEGADLIRQTHKIHIPNKPDDHCLLQFNSKEAYQIGLGNELKQPLTVPSNKVIIIGIANERFNEILPSIKESKKIKPNLDIFKNIYNKVVDILSTTKVDSIKISANERYLGKDKGWSPIQKPEINQPNQSPNRLVCIATKDRKDIQRIPWVEAEKLISDALPEVPYEYISKKEYRAFQRPKPGISFTPDNMDKKYKLIPVEVTYTPQEVVHNSYTDENGNKVYLPVTYVDHPEDNYTVFEDQFVYDEGVDGKYHPYPKSAPNRSSNKVAKCKRYKSRPNRQQGVSQKRITDKYRVSFFRKLDDGSGTAEYVYEMVGKSPEQAIYRAGIKLENEGGKLEYFKPSTELLERGSNKPKVKGESDYKLVILPKILDLPVWKDKKGNIIPWTKKVTKVTGDSKNPFEVVNEEIKTYTKYEATYHNTSSPFKKGPKKWKHPIRTKRK